uniref:Retrovirus-related Pol polyprotein from transposon TNT 1-94 n=1 Tax=Tanacetum cinerariifolium TaxID=118510 RepID=A0A6L2LRE2_TANCI|nr:retrovirus-related Pol polyprotein from transposon TNT 1-94 [Tanacetum cinerariifolium]
MFKYVRPLAGNTFQEVFRSVGWCKENSDGQKTIAEESIPPSMCQTISYIDAHVEGEQFHESKQSRYDVYISRTLIDFQMVLWRRELYQKTDPSAPASDHLHQNALLSLDPRDHPKISLGHYSIMLALSYTVKSKIDVKSPTHYLRVKMSRDMFTVSSTMRIPLLFRGEYSQWSERFMNYLEEQTDGEAMINSIKIDKSMWSDQEKKIRKIDRLARSFLIQGLPNDIYSLIDSNKTVKDLWDALERHMLGPKFGVQDRKAVVLYEYETFKATEGELLIDTYIRYLQVINDLKKCGYSKDKCELNFKFLNNLQPEWKQYAIMMRQHKNLLDINIDAFYKILKKNQGDVNDAMKSKKKAVVITSDPLALVAEQTKPTNNNLRTSSATSSANKKQEYVKSDDKKEEKKVDEKKRDMSKVKCYNCKKEENFAKDCKKAKVTDYEYYKTKMLLAKKNKDEQVLLAEDHAWMKSSSDSDQEINANMVFMAQIEKVLSDSKASSSSSDDKIAEKCLEKANQQSKDFENQTKFLQEKCDVLQNQSNTFEVKNNELNEQIKVLIEKNDDLLAQTKALQEQLKVKHVVIDNHVECQAKYAKLKAEIYVYMIRYSAYFDNDKQHMKQIADQEILFDKMSHLDTLSSVRRPNPSGVMWMKKGSSNTVKADLFSVNHSNSNKNVKRYSCKDLMLRNNSHLRDTRSTHDYNNARNAYCNSYDVGVNNLFVFDDIVQIYLWIIDSGCSKHMTGNRALLTNFVEKFLGTVRFGNNDFAVIVGYGDVVIGSMTIKRVYYVKGLGHNLFSVGQVYDKGLEVAFRKSTCFVRNEDGVDLLTDDRSSNLYTIAINEISSNSSSCLLTKASLKSWLWHQCLSHLNFTTINNLMKNNLVQYLPKMKFEKYHLCSACEQGKIHRKHRKSKMAFASNKPLYLLYMDLYGPMRVESINGKRYVLVVVDDYSRYTWRVRTDNGIEFKNKTLAKFFDEVGISQQFSAARTPQQNGVVERRNRTLVEAARTMLTFANLPLFLWVEAINEYYDSSKLKKSLTTNVESSNNEGEVFHEVSESFQGESSSSSLNDDVQQSKEEVILPQRNTQSILNDMIPNENEASSSHNVFNERLEGAYFDARTTFHDTSDVHTYYQPYPHETKYTKDHPLYKIISDLKSSVRTRGQLANSCLFACLLSSTEPANVAEALKDVDWVIAMQDELDQFARLKV